jgi:hypothetical protein
VRTLVAVVRKVINHTTAIFRQINQNIRDTHHDALEFPDGRIGLLTSLKGRQQATFLQLPQQDYSMVLRFRRKRPAFSHLMLR